MLTFNWNAYVYYAYDVMYYVGLFNFIGPYVCDLWVTNFTGIVGMVTPKVKLQIWSNICPICKIFFDIRIDTLCQAISVPRTDTRKYETILENTDTGW